MKKHITTAAIKVITLLALVTTAHAHPGPPGHKHDVSTWPFPDIKWSIAIAALLIITFTVYRLRKKA